MPGGGAISPLRQLVSVPNAAAANTSSATGVACARLQPSPKTSSGTAKIEPPAPVSRGRFRPRLPSGAANMDAGI